MKSATAYYYSPSRKNMKSIPLSYNKESWFWESNYTIRAHDEEGKWVFSKIVVEDYRGNVKDYDQTNLSHFTNINFNIINPEGDGNPPIVESMDISPKVASVGDIVSIQAKLTDIPSGVWLFAYLYYYSPSKHNRQIIDLEYNRVTNLWEGSLHISEQFEGGQWQFDYIKVMDNEGNEMDYHSLDFRSSLNFTIINPDGDGELPVLESMEVTPNEVEMESNLTIKAKITDNNNMTNSPFLYFRSPSGYKVVSTGLNYNSNTQSFEGSIPIVDGEQEGQWQFSYMEVSDNVGNKRIYSREDLQDPSQFDFVVKPKSLVPLPIVYTDKNETWSEKTIDDDLYIGPDSELTIQGNVTVNGNVYVYGTIKTYGDFTVTGTLNARQIYKETPSMTRSGTVMILGGNNHISSTNISNKEWDIPFEIYNKELVVYDSYLEIRGATLPIVDLYVNGQKVHLTNGTFKVEFNNLSEDTIIFTLVDAFENRITKEFHVYDTNPPAKVEGLKVKNKSDSSLTISWDANKESDLWGYNIYLNGQKIEDVVLPDVHEYTLKKLGSRRNYEIAVEAFDTSANHAQKAVVSTSTMLATPIVNTIGNKDTFIIGTADYFVNLNVYQGKKLITTGETNTIGAFKIPIEKLAAGTILTLKTVSEEGNESIPVDVTVKGVASPTIPIVNVVTNKSKVVTGKAEANSTVIVKNGNTIVGLATASMKGTFSVNIKIQKAGTKLTVNAKDKSGNISPKITTKVVKS